MLNPRPVFGINMSALTTIRIFESLNGLWYIKSCLISIQEILRRNNTYNTIELYNRDCKLFLPSQLLYYYINKSLLLRCQFINTLLFL